MYQEIISFFHLSEYLQIGGLVAGKHIEKRLVQLFGPIWPIRFRAVRRHSVGHRHVAIKVQPAARELSGNPSLKHPHIAKWMILDDCAMAMQAQLH